MKFSFAAVVLCACIGFMAGCDSDDPPAAPAPPLSDYVIQSSDYENHRFFRLDLPGDEQDGREQGDVFVLESIRIFKLMERGIPQVGDIPMVAAYVDSLGFRSWEDIDFSVPCVVGTWWREVSWYPLLDPNGSLIGVDLNTRFSDQDALAVIYEVMDVDGNILNLGDSPGTDRPEQIIPGEDGLYYRMKLLKAPVNFKELHSFGYVLRNIYSLGAINLDPNSFELRIESDQPGVNQPWQDETGLDYIRIFGLDRGNPFNSGFPDGQADTWDPNIFDLKRGLLRFPLDFSQPFAPAGKIVSTGDEADQNAEAIYAAHADTSSFVWNPSFLRENQAWQFYDPSAFPADYPSFSAFRIIATYPAQLN